MGEIFLILLFSTVAIACFRTFEVNADHGERPLHSVVGGSNHSESLFVCRSPSGGGDSSRPGQLSWKGCLVVTGDTSNVYPHYQVLVNVDGSARLEWADWKQFTALPPGAVNVANDVYVARDVANSALYNFVGGLYLREQYGLIVLPPMGRRLTIGNQIARLYSIQHWTNIFMKLCI